MSLAMVITQPRFGNIQYALGSHTVNELVIFARCVTLASRRDHHVTSGERTMRPKGARLTAADITGAWAIIPTPAKDNASDWRAEDTVDLVETARVVEE